MNRIVTRHILAFVALSLAFSLLPLLEAGAGRPLVPVIARSLSLALYSGFLVVFLVFLFPAFMAADPAPSRLPTWSVMAGCILVFSAIPLASTAYISGVSARGLVSVAGICAAAAGLPLAADRVSRGRRTVAICSWTGALLLFALPAATLYVESVTRPLPALLESASPMAWLHRLAVRRQTPDAAPFLAVAALAWAAALAPSFLKRGAAAAVVALAIVAAAAERPGPESPRAAVESLSGGVGRAGLRTPLRVTIAPGDGAAVLGIGGGAHRVPADGLPHDVLVVPGQATRRLRIAWGARTEELPLPVEVVPAEVRLVAWIAGAGDDLPARPPDAQDLRIVPFEPAAVPLLPGALEAFDAAVVAESRLAESRSLHAALERHAGLGGRLVGWAADRDLPAEEEPCGTGFRIRAGGRSWDSAVLGPARAIRASAIDPDLMRSFAPPHWQEMDLSALIFFTVVYHAAFLAAFLLPMLLDSRKSRGVYLVSVAFVVIVIAGGAWSVLRTIFLRDNQVYSQSLAVAMAGGGPHPRLAMRHFLGFASMSGERRSLVFPGVRDLTVHRAGDPGASGVLSMGPDGATLEDVELDRFHGKVVLRLDEEGPSPLRMVPGPPGGTAFRLVPAGDAADPWGLSRARAVEAWSVSAGKWMRRFRPSGTVFVDDGPAPDSPLPQAAEAFYRRVLGHFGVPPERYVVVRFEGLDRPDDPARYFWNRDLGGYVIFPVGDA